MNYPKNVVIRQIQFKYKVTQKQAENMYNEFEKTDDLDVLTSVVFKSDNIHLSDISALSY